jgi:hypothetical protein
LEFKKDLPVAPTFLQQMHGSMIEVVVDVGGDTRSVTGELQFDPVDPDLGRVGRIMVADTDGDFEFLIPEASWDGAYQASSLPGCKFRISLAGTSSSPNE